MTAQVPAIVERAAQLAAHDRQGVVAYRMHRTSELHAGLYHRSDDVELVAVFDGERLVTVRVLRDQTDGKDNGDAAKAQLARSLEQNVPDTGFAVPFDARHFGEYRYAVDGPRSVRFVSLERDARHGAVTFSVDATGAVVRLSYSPNVLPKYATSGTIVDDRAQVVPAFWATVREQQRYDGRYGPFHGSAIVTSDESGFRRFSDAAEAVRTVDSGAFERAPLK
ncbi:MAG: hypothetical protein ACREP1_05595 [Rhodanobacteraceae bacterium]